MPPYNNNRRKSYNNNKKSTSADWQGLLYYSIIGVLVYIVFMAIRSLSLGSGNKSSFADWLKSIFNIFQAGTGGSDGVKNGTDSGTSQVENSQGFESDVDNQGNSTELYSGAITDSVYFKKSEYFGNQKPPDNPTYISNYNKLVKDLDLIRQNFGSAVKIVTGYKGGDLAIFTECKGAHIKAVNGNNQALNNVVVALRKSNQLSGVSVYYDDGATRYYNK